MLPEKLKTSNYYLDKYSMFMRSSYGVEEMAEMLITCLVLIDDVIDDFLEMLDITNEQIFLKIYEEDADESDILDKFAHLFGLNRNFTMRYHDDDDTEHPTSITTTNFSLNNFELWMLIKAQILQNQFDGTYIQIKQYYERMNLPVQIISSATSATAYVYLTTNAAIEINNNVFTMTTNIINMFKAGLFTIKSLGIKYIHTTQLRGFLYYREDADVGDTEPQHSWEKGVWDR